MTVHQASLAGDTLARGSLAYRPVRARLVDAGSTRTIEVAIGVRVLLGEAGPLGCGERRPVLALLLDS